MNITELTALLGRIQVLDNRQVDELTIQAWTPLMADVSYAAAVDAVNDHFQESATYLVPAHIVARVKQAHRAELPATMSPEYPESCPQGDHRWMPDGTCLFCDTRRHRPEAEAHAVPRAPKPDDFEAMCAAWNDPVKWAAEVARYNDQLNAAGSAPVSSRLRG